MTLLNFLTGAREENIERWRANGGPKIRAFAPYFSFLYPFELFFYLGLASDLISPDRPTDKVDLAYLHYLPFCKVFTSKDKLHERPLFLFMRSNPTFVRSEDLKPDLAKLQKDSAYLSQNGYDLINASGKVISGTQVTPEQIQLLRAGKLSVRQRPGPKNALGSVKFMFPNTYLVYLHDTPKTELFSRSRRDFSYGCIRVQDLPR